MHNFKSALIIQWFIILSVTLILSSEIYSQPPQGEHPGSRPEGHEDRGRRGSGGEQGMRQRPPHHDMQHGERGGGMQGRGGHGREGRGMRPPHEMDKSDRKGKGIDKLSEEDKQFLSEELPEFYELVQVLWEEHRNEKGMKQGRPDKGVGPGGPEKNMRPGSRGPGREMGSPPPPPLNHIVRELRYLKEHDTDAFEEQKKVHLAEAKSLKLSLDIKKLDGGDEKETAKKQLREVLDQAFDLKMKRHYKEAEMLEKALNDVKDNIQKRIDHKDDIIDLRFKQLTQDQQHLKW